MTEVIYLKSGHCGCSSCFSISLPQCMESCDTFCLSYSMEISALLLYLSLVKTLTTDSLIVLILGSQQLGRSLAAHRK